MVFNTHNQNVCSFQCISIHITITSKNKRHYDRCMVAVEHLQHYIVHRIIEPSYDYLGT
jgi:hypothetical protein